MIQFKNLLIFLSLALFSFSCEDLNKLTEEIKDLKNNQSLIMQKQTEMLKKLALLDSKVGKNTASNNKDNNKNNNKRKGPNPNFVHNLDIGNSVVLGNPDAKVTVMKFTDFQWPFCARSVSLIDELLAKYPNDVKVVIKNFPLGSHKQARKAAQYSLAAHKQGKFKEMYHKIFDSFRDLKTNEDLPKQIAAELGLDIGKLVEDANSKEISDLIDSEYNQLTALRNAYPETDEYAAGVRLAVPKFFVNGREPIGRSLDAFSAIIDEELKK